MKSTAIIAIGLLIFATATLQQDNYCKHGMCRQCRFGLDLKTRSCTMCGRGIQTVKGAATDLVYECVDSGSIANCKKTASNLAANNGDGILYCAECNADHQYNSENSPTTCTPVVTKIENCRIYSATAGKCNQCHGGYVENAVSTACTKATEIQNCDMYYLSGTTTKCSICQKGFRESTDKLTCVAETTLIGCTQLTAPCTSCREFHWAVDYDVANGQKCEYSSSTLGIFSVVAVFILSSFFN